MRGWEGEKKSEILRSKLLYNFSLSSSDLYPFVYSSAEVQQPTFGLLDSKLITTKSPGKLPPDSLGIAALLEHDAKSSVNRINSALPPSLGCTSCSNELSRNKRREM